MGAAHGHLLHHHGHSPLHRLPAHVKLVTLLTFVIIVVLTPREAFWAFGIHAALLVAAVAVSRVPPAYLAKRMLIEIPFVVFALILPFIALGPRVAVGPVTLSEAGLIGAWGFLVKGTLGVLASLLFGATTEPRDILAALDTLKVPQPLVQIMAFMFRYLEVVTSELNRMRIARQSRGFRAHSVRQWPVLAATLGALFIRAFERGERVHLAMVSRGYSGRMPFAHPEPARTGQWVAALAMPTAALLVLAATMVR